MTDTLTRTAPKYVLEINRVLDAPVKNVWRCWTEPRLLEQWFCPKPWYISDVNQELRPGGVSAFTMHGPDGEVFPNIGVFLEVVPGRKIVTTDAFLPGWIPAERAFMVAETLMEDAGEGRTKYIARAMHWDEESLKQHEAMGFHEGWGITTTQLEALAKSL